jgi:hypothetical protein
MTDAPACGFEAVNVTVNKVRVHQSSSAEDKDAGWTDITLTPPRKINLLDLNDPTKPNFALETLGETPLAAGHYTQLRLVLVPNSLSSPLANSVVLSTDPNNPIALDTPSAIQSGIKLIHQFTVNSGQRVDLLLDFDACKSIVSLGITGKYLLKPVIKVIPYAVNGIEGFVDKTLPNVIVSAQVNGEIIRATVSNTTTDPGKFFLAHLAAGVNYDVVITADGYATAVIAAVPVPTDTSITTVSTSDKRFTLPAATTQSISGTVTLSPTDSAVDDGTVIVAAKQTLSPGPTVTVKLQVAALIAGPPAGDYAYALTLPTGAPALAAYGPLPITPTVGAQSSVAKIYTVQGFAQVVTPTGTTVYATQNPLPSAKDITIVANQTQDFTLTP